MCCWAAALRSVKSVMVHSLTLCVSLSQALSWWPSCCPSSSPSSWMKTLWVQPPQCPGLSMRWRSKTWCVSARSTPPSSGNKTHSSRQQSVCEDVNIFMRLRVIWVWICILFEMWRTRMSSCLSASLRCLIASSPHLKSRLEAAVKGNQQSLNAKASSANAAGRGAAKSSPSITLKTNFLWSCETTRHLPADWD